MDKFFNRSINKQFSPMSRTGDSNIFSVTALKSIKKSYQLRSKINKKESDNSVDDFNAGNNNNTLNSYTPINTNPNITTAESKALFRTDKRTFTEGNGDSSRRGIVTKRIVIDSEQKIDIGMGNNSSSTLKEMIRNNAIKKLREIKTLSNEINATSLKEAEKDEHVEYNRRGQNEVAKLNQWERENLWNEENFKKYVSVDLNNLNQPELECLNYLDKLKNSMEKLNLRHVSQELQEFYDKSEREEGSIFLQNLNFSKKKFDFDSLGKRNTNNSRNNKNVTATNTYAHKSSKLNPNQKAELLHQKYNNDEVMEKYEKIEDSAETLSRVEYYRQIMREKVKIESLFTKELNRVSQRIYDKKIDITNSTKKCREILVHLQELKEEFENNKKISEAELVELNERFKCIKNGNNSSLNESVSSVFSIQKAEKRQSDAGKFILEVELQKSMTAKQKEIETMAEKYKRLVEKYTRMHEETTKQLQKQEYDMKNLKFILNGLIKDQKFYYCDILKKGIDCRTDGLSWVVKKLIELGSHLEYSLFPQFLDHSQVDYLLKISYKSVECMQLKILLSVLKSKTREKNDKNLSNNDFLLRTTQALIGKPIPGVGGKSGGKFIDFSANLMNFGGSSDFYIRSFSSKVLTIFENIFRNNDSMMKMTYEQRIEDASIDILVKGLKKKIKAVDENTMNEIQQDTHSILKFFEENQKQKNMFEEIVMLREGIKQMEYEILKMREEENKKLRKRMESVRMMNNKQRISYDLVYSSLFGNNIVI